MAAPFRVGYKMRSRGFEDLDGSVAGFFGVVVWNFDQELWHGDLVKANA
jgi:hypothetical protein